MRALITEASRLREESARLSFPSECENEIERFFDTAKNKITTRLIVYGTVAAKPKSFEREQETRLLMSNDKEISGGEIRHRRRTDEPANRRTDEPTNRRKLR